MKKTIKETIIILAIILGSITFSNAQELGVRFGAVSAGNIAIDGVFSTGKYNRLHGDISFGKVVSADLLWDFLYRPITDESFNWYMGVGPYLGIFDNDATLNSDTEFQLGGAFEIGIEYRFYNVPIALGLDYRPALEVIQTTQLHLDGFGFNIRYIFGQ